MNAPTPDGDVELREVITRLALFAEITNAVTSTLDSIEALQRLARLVVPVLGDWCVVDMFTSPDRVERVAVAHRDPDRLLSAKYEGPLPPLTDDASGPLAWVLRGSPPRLLSPIPPPDDAEGSLTAEQYDLFAELEADSAIVAPLRARSGHVVGAITIVRTDPDRPLTADHIDVVDNVARRAAIAVENAQLYTAQRQVAETLQRSMLPTPPLLDELRFAAEYCPAGQATEVGGDWYDVFVLPNGKVAMIIGDVAGHDLDAAIRMGRLQSMLRGLACDRLEPPGAVLARLDQLASHLKVIETATVIYAVLEEEPEGGWGLFWSNAGHPPPLLVHPDGQTEFLDEEPDPLLGAVPSATRHSHHRRLPAESTVVFYTDGIIETRERSLLSGMTALAAVAGAQAGQPVDVLTDTLRQQLTDGSQDDVALLSARLPRLQRDKSRARG